MVIFEVEEVQGGLLMDQVRTVVPAVKPVTVEFGNKELVMTPGPDTFIHPPVPAAATFPANVTEPVLTQIVWLGPAFAGVGTALPTIITLSNDATQGALEVVHRNVLLPTPKPVIVVAGLVGVVIVPDPPINVQSPAPAVGVFAAIVALELTQTV